MVKCKDCKQEMDQDKKGCSDTCIIEYMKLGGKVYKRNSSYFDINKRCHDCGIINKRGNTHHSGCDMERCPRCKGQLISCDCWEAEEKKKRK